MERQGQYEEIAAAHLASGGPAYIIGMVYVADGGATM